MYTQSGERLRDFIYESTLNLNEIEAIAYSELKSDGVLKEIGGKRIIFFHQTFLEYAIARWLYGTNTGEQERIRLESQLNTSQTTYSRYYLWTVLRQLLTLVHLNEFHRLSHQLDTQQILPFRSVAFAAVSRHEPESASILPQLLSIALTKDYSFHEALLIAANSAPLRHGDMVWQIVVKLLEEVNNDLINKATEIAAELLVRLTTDSGSRFQAAIDAITQRTAKTKAKKDERYLIFGKLLGTYAHQRPRKNQPIELEVLHTLKAHYTLFGGNVRAIVIDLYLTPHVPPEIQREFLLTILTQPVSESFKEKDKAIELLQKRLPSFLKTADTPFGASWFTALHAPLIEASPSQPTPGDHIHATWRPVIATVVGYHAASDTDLLTTLMSHLFGEHLSENSGQFVRSNYLAIEAAIHQGAADSVASLLLSIPIDTIIPSQISLVSTLLKTLADSNLQPIVADGEGLSPSSPPSLSSFNSTGRRSTGTSLQALTQWILPRVSQHPVELIRAIDALATNSPPVQQQLAQLLDSLLPTLPPRQANGIVKKLNRIPPSLEPYLQQTIQSKESRVALVKLYRSQIEKGSHAAMTPLLNFCLDKSRDVAQSASWVVLDFASQIQAASQIAPICVQSPITGVRQNGLKALIAAMNGGLQVSETEIETLFNALAEDKAPEVLQLLYELVNCCLWHHHSISQELAQATFKLTQRLVEQNHKATLDMTTKAAFITLNQMLNLEDIRLVPPIRDCTRALLRATDIGQKVDRLIITGILTKLAKYNSDLLAQIVREDLVINGRVLPAANLYAIAIAIVHDQGKNAPLLNEILQDERLTNDVKSRILRERGL